LVSSKECVVKVVKASISELSSAVEALSERLIAKMGAEAFARHFPEIAEVCGVGEEAGESLYSGSGRFGFLGNVG
jgi:hypothetical protein